MFGFSLLFLSMQRWQYFVMHVSLRLVEDWHNIIIIDLMDGVSSGVLNILNII